MTKMPGPMLATTSNSDRGFAATSVRSGTRSYSPWKVLNRRLDSDETAPARSLSRCRVNGRLPAIAKPAHHRVPLGQRLGDEHRRIDDAVSQHIRTGVDHARDSLQGLG